MADDIFPAYGKLLKRAREIALLDSAGSLLSWDEETYLPAKALEHRAAQMAYFSGQAHRLFTATKVGEWISECEQHGFAPDSDAAANVREWRRSYDRKTKIPVRLVEKFQRVRTQAREAGGEARKESKLKIFRPHLQKPAVQDEPVSQHQQNKQDHRRHGAERKITNLMQQFIHN